MTGDNTSFFAFQFRLFSLVKLKKNIQQPGSYCETPLPTLSLDGRGEAVRVVAALVEVEVLQDVRLVQTRLELRLLYHRVCCYKRNDSENYINSVKPI